MNLHLQSPEWMLILDDSEKPWITFNDQNLNMYANIKKKKKKLSYSMCAD